ncbi:DUF6073 family protein, partial [Bacteroidota bacterium]
MNRYTTNLLVIPSFLLLIMFTTITWGQHSSCEQFPPAGTDHSQSLGVVELEIPMFGLSGKVFLTGPTIIQRSEPFVDPYTGDSYIQTEIISMQLQGDVEIAPGQFLPLFINLNPDIHSYGQIIDINPDSRYDFPAESFFDVFVEAFMETPYGPLFLHNEEPLMIFTEINCIPPYGNSYEHDLDDCVPLLDSQGNTIANICNAAHKLENPLFSVVPGGNLDLGGLGPFNFTAPDRSFFGGGIVEPEMPSLGFPPIGRIAPILLGLVEGFPGSTDNLNAFSFGYDEVEHDALDIISISFSVDAASSGAPGTGVENEVIFGTDYSFPDVPAPPEQSADIFFSPGNGMNFQLLDEKDATCTFPNMTVTNSIATSSNCNAAGWPGGANPEDTDALEISNIFFVGSDPDFDGLIDILNGNLFFSLDPTSVSVGLAVPDFRPGPPDGVATPDDILTSPPPGGAFGVYASGVLDIGLIAGDDLDALCLLDNESIGYLDPGTDIALFSLAPGSPSLGGSPADIFFTNFNGSFSLYTTAAMLGLLSTDNIDAMDCQILVDIPDTTGCIGIDVWPGDADNNGEVHVYDVLFLGLYYNKTGASRPVGGCLWEAQCCPADPPWTPANAVYADCNGDGIVNAADVLCIGLNYGNTHPLPSGKTNNYVALNKKEQPALSFNLFDINNNIINEYNVREGEEYYIETKLVNGSDLLGIAFGIEIGGAGRNRGAELVKEWEDEGMRLGSTWGNNTLSLIKENRDKGLIEAGITNIGKELGNKFADLGRIKIRIINKSDFKI